MCRLEAYARLFGAFCLCGVLAVVSACTVVTHNSQADAENLSLVCIAESSEQAMPALIEAVEQRLAAQGLASQRGVTGSACKHILEYSAQASSGAAPYLQNAQFTLLENGASIGTAKYRDRGGPAEKRAAGLAANIAPVVDALFGFDSPEALDPQLDQKTESELACTDLVLDYAWHRDEHNIEPLVSLFTTDARMSVLGATLVGEPAIRERTQAAFSGLRTRHLMSAVNVEILSEDRARGRSYVTVYAAPADDSAGARPVLEIGDVALVGYYVDEFERTPNGWRIASRELKTDYLSPSLSR